MSREEKARAGAQAVIGEDEILDVAVVVPRGSTKASVLGAIVGSQLGGDNAMAWGIGGAMLGQRVNSATKGSYPSVVLALSESRLYVLGREKSGVVGGWKKVHRVGQIDRADLAVTQRRSGTVRVLELTDTTSGATLEFEVMNVGNLGLKDLIENAKETEQ